MPPFLKNLKRRNFLGLGSTGVFTGLLLEANGQSPGNRVELPRDGAGFLGRFGVLTPDFDPVPESELQVMAPRGISLHSSRLKYKRTEPATFTSPPNIDNALALLTDLKPKAILCAFTSSTYVLEASEENQVVERLEKQASGVPAIWTCRAALDSFNHLGAKKIALIHPPWFSEEANRQGRAYFETKGLTIISCQKLEPAREFTEVDPGELIQWITNNANNEADLIFIGGNGMRTAGAISMIEKRLNKPVVTANQVLLWAALRHLPKIPAVRDYGRIFRT